MHFSTLLSLLALSPALTLATPVQSPNTVSTRSPLLRRGGHDLCGQNLPRAGEPCGFGASETEPHACSIDDETVVMECRGYVWVVDHKCPASQSCRCDKGTPERGNLVCR